MSTKASYDAWLEQKLRGLIALTTPSQADIWEAQMAYSVARLTILVDRPDLAAWVEQGLTDLEHRFVEGC